MIQAAMNIREELQKEHSRKNALNIAEYACFSKKNFKELMMCFLDNDQCIAQRAAWSVSWAAQKKTDMVIPYIKDLVLQLQRKEAHNAIVRNSLRVLEHIEIPEIFHGEVMNACFGFIESPTTPVAIKSFSLTVLFRLSFFYPDIQHELKLIIEDRWDTETAAFKSRGKNILHALRDVV